MALYITLYSFFALYANVDGFSFAEKEVPLNERPEIDRWILSCLHTLIRNVDKELSEYSPTKAGRLIDAFVNDDLSNWYVRLNRKRFWGKEMSTDKLSAYQTLYTCLETVSKLLAPFAPFFADRLYCDLMSATHREAFDSVHLAHYPEAKEEYIDHDLEERMSIAQKITSMILALRRKVNIKVRQPLQQIMVPAVDDEQRKHIEAIAELVKNEVNVKELNFIEGDGVLVKKIKCNFRTLGKKYGKLMKDIANKVNTLTQEDILEIERSLKEKANYVLGVIAEQEVILEKEDVEIINEDIPGWLVANEGNVTVALEVELTEELLQEGLARELINRIQNMRKDNGLEITDRIDILVADHEK